MARLADTFRTPDARVWRTVVAVDLTDSTKMKEDQGEAGWLNTYGWFFDMLTETINKSTAGTIVKYLGDGVMAVYLDDDVAGAINWAIVVQEEMAGARAVNLVRCSCSIGIASGDLVEFDSPAGGKDYIGTVADRAFRLCSAANANAVFVDTDTVAAAAMTKVVSKAGRSVAPKRTAAEYQGKEQSVKLKGFTSPVTYYEILWENGRFSVKPQVATELSATLKDYPLASAASPERGGPPAEREARGSLVEWIRGRVTTHSDRYGFIEGPSAESFWFNKDYLFKLDQSLSLVPGADVWFLPLDPIGVAKNRRASAIILNGQTISGSLEKVHPNGYGFARCRAQAGDSYTIFVNLGDASLWNRDDPISFTIGVGRKGMAGFRPKKESGAVDSGGQSS